MNCINHPETPVASYCQNCGKPLCSLCVRPVAGHIYCENCLAAKVGIPAAGGPQPGIPIPPGAIPALSGPNPTLATLLGFIPGVGAMYNGQFFKALVHVLVFAVLVAVADDHGIFGLFIAAWVFYQVFDANQTAKARRDGLPLPDPFGLNDLGNRFGIHGSGPVPPTPQSGFVPPAGPAAAPFVGGYPPPPPAPPPYTPFVSSTPYPPPPPPVSDFEAVGSVRRSSVPSGAIALIVLGLLFLFGTLNILRFDFIGRGWPLILIGIGVFLFIKRMRESREGGVQ